MQVSRTRRRNSGGFSPDAGGSGVSLGRQGRARRVTRYTKMKSNNAMRPKEAWGVISGRNPLLVCVHRQDGGRLPGRRGPGDCVFRTDWRPELALPLGTGNRANVVPQMRVDAHTADPQMCCLPAWCQWALQVTCGTVPCCPEWIAMPCMPICALSIRYFHGNPR